MLSNLFIFAASFFLVLSGANMTTKYSARLAEGFRLSKYLIGFIVVAIISILPETFIAINAAIENLPSFGLGVLFGSNIADLTLVFAVIIFITGRSIKVESKILKNHIVYPFFLLVPLILGVNGHFSRLEGAALIVAGLIFYVIALKSGIEKTASFSNNHRLRNFFLLLFSMFILLFGSHFVVLSATGMAQAAKVSPMLIGLLVVGIGTTLPELSFALKCVKKHDDSLAVGDILGTVLADATIVVGIIALIAPFSFSVKIIYIAGAFMVLASFTLFAFLRSGRMLSKKEGFLLFLFWLTFISVEFIVNR